MPEQDALERTELFRELPPPVRDRLTAGARTLRVDRGALLFRKGDHADDLYVAIEGRIAICVHASDGRESVVAVLGPGTLFGELPLFDGGVRSADARALTPSQLVAVRFDDVRAALVEQPDVLWDVLRLLSRRLRVTDEALTDAMFLDVPGRTAKRLLEIAGDEDQFELPLTQEELAGVVGASRERVNRAIATFTKLGWIAVEGRNRYQILDRESLVGRATT